MSATSGSFYFGPRRGTKEGLAIKHEMEKHEAGDIPSTRASLITMHAATVAALK